MNLFDTIEKPTLLLDPETARRNIRRMAEKARRNGVRFRPHFKTHQSAEIGEWLRDEGVEAITVSSVDMAGYFARHGWEDITIAFPANLRQTAALQALAQQVRLGLLVESAQAARFLSARLPAAVDVWIKVDAGSSRTGLSWERPEAVCELAMEIRSLPGLRLRGLLTHAGHTYQARGAAEVRRRYSESVGRMAALREALERAGVAGLEISVGDTPGCSLCEDLGEVDEIRPGNFVFYDAQQLAIGACAAGDVAVALACPVVSLHAERNELVIYGGAIHLSKDTLPVGEQAAYGLVALPEAGRWGPPLEGAFVRGLSQEHGMVHMPPEHLARVQVGELVCVLPAHSCLTVQAMRDYLTLDGRVIGTLNS